jgi:hypothetical protein
MSLLKHTSGVPEPGLHRWEQAMAKQRALEKRVEPPAQGH